MSLDTPDLITPTPDTDQATAPTGHTTTEAPEATTDQAPQPTGPTFASLDLPAPLMAAVDQLGFVTPSAIQARAIPELLAGRDITGVAQTGTGKTAAFGLPLLAAVDPALRKVQALVLTPTRELAMQVADAIESFASKMDDVRVLPVYGGAPYVPQQRALRDGVHVVVGTPGRIKDHLERGALNLDDIRFLVLDEADEMLRMGFAEDVEEIFGQAPAKRQVALFSATMPPAIRKVADQHLTDPVQIAVARQSSTVTAVRQTYAVVPFRHKVGSLARVLATSDADAAIVFTRTRGAAEDVGSALVEKGISAATISGDVAQKEREKIVERLRTGALDVLVATDVAARGLDVDRIGLVVNFDVPGEPEAYVHRIGRTGRAGRTGEALTFVTPHERGKLRSIERTIRAQLEEVDIPSPKDVSAHRVKRTLDKVAARREAGRLEMYTDLIRTYTQDNDIDPLDVAAAIAALAVGDDGPRARAEQEEYERERAEAKAAAARRTSRDGDRHDRSSGFSRGRSEGERGIRRPARGTRYRIAVGHTHGVQPGGIVGALTGEGGITGADVGKIDIFGSFSLVDITAPLDNEALDRLARARVAGKPLRITLDRGAPRGGERGPRGGGDHRRPDGDRGPRGRTPQWEARSSR
ncbi:DEAD/DEAH box helicase [Promicromonospora thailandica]|uniref:RNA helicase n=1 Tax=Promicromonospora thailandica TaxID=765201 RepID=A0A9X2G1N8_9MICO|nr:DEAD/DEAH box helicase [Promicromonospora thailandica]MCP2265420.1 ATP-dependent RNA helicase DeaD [Promicromonospora thailandica]